MIALLIASSAPSKVPVYVAGGAFVLWAVVLAGLGLTRPAFPYGQRGARLVMGTSVVLAVITMAMAVVTSSFGS